MDGTFFSAAPSPSENPRNTCSFPIAYAKGRTNGRTFEGKSHFLSIVFFVFVAIAIFVGWKSPTNGQSNANGKAVICEPKFAVSKPMEMHLRAYSFKSDKVTTEEISRIGDRYEMDAYMPRDFYSEDDQLKWGEYNSFWKRWGGESLN